MLEEIMEIKANKSENVTELVISGRLDTTTAPELEVLLIPAFQDTPTVVVNLAEINYVSSAGLRALLAGQKESKKRGGKMIVRKVLPEVMEVFEMTGFSDVLTIEE
jgi:anti-sigma B factor antagonist